MNFGFLNCKWKRAKSLQTEKDQERNCQLPWLTSSTWLSWFNKCADTTVIQNHASSQFGPADLNFYKSSLEHSVSGTLTQIEYEHDSSSPPYPQDYVQYHSETANAELPHISMKVYPTFHHTPVTSSQQCMRAMASERRIMLSSCLTVILQDDLVTPEPSRCRSRLYCSTMKSSDSLDICVASEWQEFQWSEY